MLITRPGQNFTDISSYRQISVWPIYENILNLELSDQDWNSDHQFRFPRGHLTVQQCHRIIDVISKAHSNVKKTHSTCLLYTSRCV